MSAHTSPDLATLLQEADAAAPSERINWRDPIAAQEAGGVAAMADWLKEGKHTGFAIRTLERIGKADDPLLAAQAVRAMRGAQRGLRKEDREMTKRSLSRLGEPARPTTPEPDPRLYERVIAAARAGATISYSEAGAPAELDMNLSHHRRLMGQMLGEISTRESRAQRPLLSSVVVLKGTTSTGSGFYQLGLDLDCVRPGEDAATFTARQQQETFAFWSAHPEAGPLE